MRVPISWLKEYVEIDITPAELAARLTFSGSEVEGIITIGAALPGVIVGEIREVRPHPNADKLKLCKVFDGVQELAIVCGAPNGGAGDKVALAPVGASLPNGLKIKSAKLRGELSQGMLCAEDELGISDDHSGLLILPPATRAGTPLTEVLGPPETVLVVAITPNRPDCLSLIGMAREVAGLLRRPLKVPEFTLKESDPVVTDLASVRVEDPAGCPRYTARVINHVTIQPSPRWMQQRLAAAGIRPINNIVDITNYVMLECGQPLHAFDRELLGQGQIVVRRAAPGEEMATLDGTAREITPEMLMICDARQPVAVAGVMGGAGSEIRNTTRNVLLESACFQPTSIRRTSKRLGLVTESSGRYERGVDPNLAEWASRRAAFFMAELGGGTVARGVIDSYPCKPVSRRITMRYARTRALLGVDLTADQMIGLLESVQLSVGGRDAQACTVEVPTFRFDLEREADLAEEIARLHGLDKVPAPVPQSKIIPGVSDRPTRALMMCRATLVSLGLTECLHYSFVSERLLNLFDPGDIARRVILPNPISADHTTMRNTLIPQMVDTLGRNRAHQVADAALFEMGRVFFQDASGQYKEEDRLCVGLMGEAGRTTMARAAPAGPEEVFQWIRGIAEELGRSFHLRTRAIGVDRTLDLAFEGAAMPYFEPGMGAAVTFQGQRCGLVGILRAALCAEWRITEPVAVLELALAPLFVKAFDIASMTPVPIYPPVTRDMAVIVGEQVENHAIMQAALRVAPPEMVDIRLFDIYRGANVGAGRKSMAYSLTYQSSARTLTDEDANRLHATVQQAVVEALGAEIRAGQA